LHLDIVARDRGSMEAVEGVAMKALVAAMKVAIRLSAQLLLSFDLAVRAVKRNSVAAPCLHPERALSTH
jgi:hypothetical protein